MIRFMLWLPLSSRKQLQVPGNYKAEWIDPVLKVAVKNNILTPLSGIKPSSPNSIFNCLHSVPRMETFNMLQDSVEHYNEEH
jgi:hypothetical protein